MNHEEVTLELLVRNGYTKATERFVLHHSKLPKQTQNLKLQEAEAYWNIQDMWQNEKTNANLGVEASRAEEFYHDRQIREYLQQTPSAEFIRDFLSLVSHAVCVRLSPGGDLFGALENLALLKDPLMYEALAKTCNEWENGAKARAIVSRGKYAFEELKKKNKVRYVEKYSSFLQELEDAVSSFSQELTTPLCAPVREPLVPEASSQEFSAPTARVSRAITDFESIYGHLSDNIFRIPFNSAENEYLGNRIAWWWQNDKMDQLCTLHHFEIKISGEEERGFDPTIVATHLGNALALELKQKHFKRVSFSLEFPACFIDRKNPDLQRLVQAYDLAVETEERKFPEYSSFRYVCG